MKDERVNIRPKLRDQERNAVRHQPGDEMHVAGQPVELCDDERAPLAPRLSENCCKLRSAFQGVGALPRLDLDEDPQNLKALLGRKKRA